MTKYLIVKCRELHDPFECEFDREAFWLVDDWKKWYKKHTPDYTIEVYKFTGTGDKEAELLYTIYGEETYQWALICDAEKEK